MTGQETGKGWPFIADNCLSTIQNNFEDTKSVI